MSRHGYVPLGGDNPPHSSYYDQGKFGRMFPALPPFAADTPTLRERLKKIGQKGGIMDANDDITDPVGLIVDAKKSLENPNNSGLTAGVTFFGQFIDHDMTFDPTSSLERQQDPETIANFRTPTLALDQVYGAGPDASPHLYDQTIDRGFTSFLVENNPGSEAVSTDGIARFDLPRNSQETALIGDPRNDENLIVSQLHLAFLKFHNEVVQHAKTIVGLTNPREVFEEAQRLVRWHYQWIILHEFLPNTVGQALVDDILKNGRKFYKWRHEPYIPVEFSVAAYRFGHSQVRPSYRAQFGNKTNQQFIALFLDDSIAADIDDPNDLRGGKRQPRRFVDWQTFFDFGPDDDPADNSRPNKKIDTKLSTALFGLAGPTTAGPSSLAERNLLRSLTFGVPSGQSIAKAMGETPLRPDQLTELKEYQLETRTPLWFYILKEAEILGLADEANPSSGGSRLGPVGGRIVAEVLIGLLEGDSSSYLRQDPSWVPTFVNPKTTKFEMVDLLRFAKVFIRLQEVGETPPRPNI